MRISRKNKILLAAILVLFFVSYKLAIEKTFGVRGDYLRLKSKSEQTKDLPAQIAFLAAQNRHYDSVLTTANFMETSVQNNLLRMINMEAEKNKVKILEFNKPHYHEEGEQQIYTYNMKLSGSYAAILITIHSIEAHGSFGDVVHIDFEKKINYKTNKYTLGAMIFVQQVR